jgi:hypothetical protein
MRHLLFLFVQGRIAAPVGGWRADLPVMQGETAATPAPLQTCTG